MAVASSSLDRGPTKAGIRATILLVWAAVAAAGFLFFALHLAFGLGGAGLDEFTNKWLYDALELLAAAGCLLRSLWVRSERAAWVVLGLGVLSFAAGDVVFDFYYGGNPPGVSLADVEYLAFYPASYVGLLLLLRPHVRGVRRSIWLDGMMAALAIAAVGSAVLLEAVLRSTGAVSFTVIVNLAYPLGDIFLVALVGFVFAVSGWRPGRAWATIGLAFALAAVADSIYLFQSATNSYVEGTLLDALWPASVLLL